jgi:hypothetical protein
MGVGGALMPLENSDQPKSAPHPERPREVYDPAHVETITRIVEKKPGELKAAEKLADGVLTLEFQMDSYVIWVRFKFLQDAKDFFPAAFQVAGVNRACLEATDMLIDVRGNSRRERLLSICMDRKNAETVNWRRVDSDNLPKIANSFWMHPVLDK